MKNRVLVIAAHPDDEALGCAGTIAKHIEATDQVYVIFMSNGVSSRAGANLKSATKVRIDSANKSCKVLKTEEPIFLDFPDNKMDSIPLLDIVQKLEECVIKINPNMIYTHHGFDLNIDHRITHQAVLTACRPQPGFSVKEIYSFEVLSSTDWATSSTKNAFIPSKFVDISKTFNQKMNSLNCYSYEMRQAPHSRSIDSVKALSILRGSTVGVTYAEAFQVERIIS